MIAVMLVMMTRQADIVLQAIPPLGGIRPKSSQPKSVYRRGPNFFRPHLANDFGAVTRKRRLK